MKFRQLADTGVFVSELCLGTMTFGGRGGMWEVIAGLDQAGVDEINRQFAQVEQIKKFVLVGEEWLPDTDVLTPTSKLKRRGVNSYFAAGLDMSAFAPLLSPPEEDPRARQMLGEWLAARVHPHKWHARRVSARRRSPSTRWSRSS